MKKIVSVLIALAFVLAFAACSKEKNESKYAQLTAGITKSSEPDAVDAAGAEAVVEDATEAEPEPVVEVDYSNSLTGTYVNPDDFTQYIVVKAMTDGTYVLTYGEAGVVFADMEGEYFESENYSSITASVGEKYPDYNGEIRFQKNGFEVSYWATFNNSGLIGTYNYIVIAEKVSDSVNVKMVADSLPVNNNATPVHFFEQVEVRDIVPNDECLPLITLYNDNTFDFWCNMYYGMIPLRGVWFEGKQGNDTTYYLTVQYSNYMNQYHPLTYDEFSVHDFRLSTVTGTDQVVFSASGQSICFGMTGEDGAGYDSFKIIY